jgi:hypothetical protein
MAIERRLTKAAVAKASAWGSVADLNRPNTGILPTNAGAIKPAYQVVEDETYGAFEKYLDTTFQNAVDFTLDFDYRFDGLENFLMALLFGIDSVTDNGDGSFTHKLSLADRETGFVSYAVEKGSKFHCVPSAKVTKVTLSVNNGLVKMSVALRGNLVDDTTIVTLEASTVPGSPKYKAKFANARFRLNSQAGAALGDDDIVHPNNYTLEFERKPDAEHVAGLFGIIEPLETDKPQIKLTLEFPRMDAINAAYFKDWSDGNEKKADIVFPGPTIPGTSRTYQLKFDLPRLAIEDVEFADSKIIPAKVVLRALEAETAPLGMTGETKPIYAELTTRLDGDWSVPLPEINSFAVKTGGLGATQVTLEWDVTGADYFKVQLYNEAEQRWETRFYSDDPTETEGLITGLTPETTYHAILIAGNSGGESASDVLEFTTLAS